LGKKKQWSWNQTRRYRGKIYNRHSGYPNRNKALQVAKEERKKGYKSHVKKDEAGRGNYAVWTTRRTST
jgi:hypothetical protein